MSVKKILAYILLALLLRLVFYSTIALAQQQGDFPLVCPDKQTLQDALNFISAAILVVIIAIVLFIVLFNMLGTVSTIAMRLGEFFTERIRFVFELLLIYVLFIWNLGNAIDGDGSSNQTGTGTECAEIDWNTLFESGPLFFQLVGYLLRLLGIEIQ